MIKETKVNSRKLHMVVLCIIFVVLSACTNSIKENENKVKEKRMKIRQLFKMKIELFQRQLQLLIF